MRPALALACLLTACLLAGCGGKDEDGVARRADGSTLDALPTPERARGSVTGMPDAPGPGPADNASASLDAIADADVGVDLDGDGEIDPIAPDDASTEDDGTGNPSGEPTAPSTRAGASNVGTTCTVSANPAANWSGVCPLARPPSAHSA